MAIDLSKFAIGGAMRPDSFTGMNPDFLNALTTLIASAPPEIQQNIRINSGFRSPERQKQLWEQALQKYGSPEKARKWVAPPGRSFHNHGTAADLKFLNDAAKAWVHQNAGQFGLAFPLANEPWHIELQGNRGGGQGPAGGAAPAMVGGGGGGPALGFMPTGAQDAPEAPCFADQPAGGSVRAGGASDGAAGLRRRAGSSDASAGRRSASGHNARDADGAERPATASGAHARLGRAHGVGKKKGVKTPPSLSLLVVRPSSRSQRVTNTNQSNAWEMGGGLSPPGRRSGEETENDPDRPMEGCLCVA